MIRPSLYLLIFLSLSIFEGYSKKYLIETDDDDDDEETPNKNMEYGFDYGGGWKPRPYGHPTEEVATTIWTTRWTPKTTKWTTKWIPPPTEAETTTWTTKWIPKPYRAKKRRMKRRRR